MPAAPHSPPASATVQVHLHILPHPRLPNLFRAVLGTFDIMQKSIIREKRRVAPPHIYVEPAIRGVDILEFFKADEVFEQSLPAIETFREELDHRLPAP